MEKGSAVSEYEHRQVGTELFMARRYFERRNGINEWLGSGYVATSTLAVAMITYLNEKRIAPTITLSDSAALLLAFRGGGAAPTAAAFTGVSERTLRADLTVTGTTIGDGCLLQLNNGPKSIEFDAEL